MGELCSGCQTHTCKSVAGVCSTLTFALADWAALLIHISIWPSASVAVLANRSTSAGLEASHTTPITLQPVRNTLRVFNKQVPHLGLTSTCVEEDCKQGTHRETLPANYAQHFPRLFENEM